jgi:hypothetical protein
LNPRQLLLKKPLAKADKSYLLGIPQIQETELSELVPTYYYYKRWVWLIFPQACMIQKKSCNFSDTMTKSNMSSTKSMNVLDEK